METTRYVKVAVAGNARKTASKQLLETSRRSASGTPNLTKSESSPTTLNKTRESLQALGIEIDESLLSRLEGLAPVGGIFGGLTAAAAVIQDRGRSDSEATPSLLVSSPALADSGEYLNAWEGVFGEEYVSPSFSRTFMSASELEGQRHETECDFAKYSSSFRITPQTLPRLKDLIFELHLRYHQSRERFARLVQAAFRNHRFVCENEFLEGMTRVVKSDKKVLAALFSLICEISPREGHLQKYADVSKLLNALGSFDHGGTTRRSPLLDHLTPPTKGAARAPPGQAAVHWARQEAGNSLFQGIRGNSLPQNSQWRRKKNRSDEFISVAEALAVEK